MSDQPTRRDRRMPWAFAIGAPLALFGLFALIAGRNGPTATALVVFGAGLLLACTGLVQRSIERSR